MYLVCVQTCVHLNKACVHRVYKNVTAYRSLITLARHAQLRVALSKTPLISATKVDASKCGDYSSVIRHVRKSWACFSWLHLQDLHVGKHREEIPKWKTRLHVFSFFVA